MQPATLNARGLEKKMSERLPARRDGFNSNVLRFRLRLMPGDSLRRQASRALSDVISTKDRWHRHAWPVLIFLFQALLLALAYWEPNWPVRFNSGDLTTLTALWQIEATLFGLVAGLTPLLIATFTDPLDRKRMLRRYRDYAFDWVVVLGLQTLLLTGIVLLGLRLNESTPTDGRQVGALWMWASFLVLIAGLLHLIQYTYRLVAKLSDEKAKWIREEAHDYFVSSMVDAYSRQWLKHWMVKEFPAMSQRVQIEYDVRGLRWDKLKSETAICKVSANPDHQAYLADISLGRLRAALKKILLEGADDQSGLCLVGTPHRFLLPRAAVVVAWDLKPFVDRLHKQIEQVRRAYLVVEPPSNPLYFRTAFKDLRDRASAAARNGNIAEFESLLEIFKDLTVIAYDLSQKFDEKLKSREGFEGDEGLEKLAHIYPDTTRPVVLNVEPRVALRGAVHELGEEVLAATSPNVLKAWLHHPHRVLEATRSCSIRTVAAIMYPWFRAANFVRSPGSTPEGLHRRGIVLQSLRRRLLTYGQNLLMARKLEGPEGQHGPLQTEFEWFLRVLGKLLSVIDIGERRVFMEEKLQRVLDLFPELESEHKTWKRTIWIECARHLAADFLNPEVVSGPKKDTVGFADSMRDVKEKVKTLSILMTAWTNLLKSQGWSERQISFLYERLIDMTWEEQMEIGQGVFNALVVKHRGRACIAWLAMELYESGSISSLAEEQQTNLSILVYDDNIIKDVETIGTTVHVSMTGEPDRVRDRISAMKSELAGRRGIAASMRTQLAIASQILDNPGGGLLFATQAMGQVNATLRSDDPKRWKNTLAVIGRAEAATLRRDFETARLLLREAIADLDVV